MKGQLRFSEDYSNGVVSLSVNSKSLTDKNVRAVKKKRSYSLQFRSQSKLSESAKSDYRQIYGACKPPRKSLNNVSDIDSSQSKTESHKAVRNSFTVDDKHQKQVIDLSTLNTSVPTVSLSTVPH